ncbi:CGNR zinc finger domain-containing protein [Actinoplanes auranticolor]|uniref:CGNR zinc finger domain-containing protein n=1 Tax=Actinoplanes auranticolor TaxID=47988 RepID=UPI0034DAF7C4
MISAVTSAAGSRTRPGTTCRTRWQSRSPSATGAWHDMKTCGNTTNLRASGARRRDAARDERRSAGS